MFYHVLPTLPFKVSPCHPCAQAITGHHGQSAVSLVLDPASCRCRSMPKNGSLAKLHNDLCQLNKNTCFTKKTLGGPIVKLNIRKSASEMITDSGAECTSSMVKFKGETRKNPNFEKSCSGSHENPNCQPLWTAKVLDVTSMEPGATSPLQLC